MEQVLQEKEGRQLMIELYYNYGVMLLLLDRLVPSIARERMVVCYTRYKSAYESESTKQVARICKGTGAYFKLNENTPRNSHLPPKYPCDYFARMRVDRALVENLINILKDDDIYN